ncbi:MAG: hypothetical protein WA056_02170 [Gallionella sp.]
MFKPTSLHRPQSPQERFQQFQRLATGKGFTVMAEMPSTPFGTVLLRCPNGHPYYIHTPARNDTITPCPYCLTQHNTPRRMVRTLLDAHYRKAAVPDYRPTWLSPEGSTIDLYYPNIDKYCGSVCFSLFDEKTLFNPLPLHLELEDRVSQYVGASNYYPLVIDSTHDWTISELIPLINHQTRSALRPNGINLKAK